MLAYYVYVATSAAWFMVPIWTLFLLDSGLSYTQIALLNTAWWVSVLVGEIPTGYVGDRIGRRNSLVLGAILQAGGVAIFGLLDSFWPFLAIYVTWGVGNAFRSGSDSAWLYDVLKERGSTEAYTRLKGRGSAVMLTSGGLSALVGGYLASIDLYYPFAFSAVFVALGIPVLFTLPETEASGDDETLSFTGAMSIARETLDQPRIRPFVGYVVLVFAVGWSIDLFTQPLAIDAGLDRTQIGWLYAGFTVVSATMANFADRIEAALGSERWMRLVPVVLGVLYVVTAFVPILAIPTFFAMRGLVEASGVLQTRFLNDNAGSLGRATVLSTVSMISSVVRIPVRFAVGPVGDHFSPLVAIAAVGGLLLAGSLAIRLWPSPSVREEAMAASTAD